MEKQFGIREVLRDHKIIPVINISDVNQVESIIANLQNQGINCIEITLRSECAFEAIEKAMQIKSNDFKVGVGTIISSDHVEKCSALNVDFMVSPGVSVEVEHAFNKAKIPFLPGVMTPSEIISGLGRGWDTFKLFPFNLSGGIKALKTYGNVFEQVIFCPTGGISESNFQECLDLKNVISVGGSWVLKKKVTI
ncbi:bifunctional 4-hydroxy-2-oxoglutarate aldolase/2-dehydro-3-deoxy-phosphogluconate aldolase [Flavobacteriales bacterium]|nr:bifunctional 4-hydroxy-2-oxoglutarate aldolase/2-dehydro-3-deoxy-phosphogluconate aldolase [Flavobacteriales bacterium]